MKKIFVLLLFYLFITSCSSVNDKYFVKVEGEWQITKFYHLKKDLQVEDYYLLGFEKSNNLWMIKRENRIDKFFVSNCKFFTKSDTLKIDITKSEDDRFNGDYNVYIDTIQDTGEEYIIRLTLDSENTYIEAIRPKIKGNN